MTSKEQVLAVYPDAVASNNFWGRPLWCVYIGNFDETHKKIHNTWITIIATDYSEEQVWDRAWQIIGREMLKKLES